MDLTASPVRKGVEMNEMWAPGRDGVEMDWLNLQEELMESEEAK